MSPVPRLAVVLHCLLSMQLQVSRPVSADTIVCHGPFAAVRKLLQAYHKLVQQFEDDSHTV